MTTPYSVQSTPYKSEAPAIHVRLTSTEDSVYSVYSVRWAEGYITLDLRKTNGSVFDSPAGVDASQAVPPGGSSWA